MLRHRVKMHRHGCPRDNYNIWRMPNDEKKTLLEGLAASKVKHVVGDSVFTPTVPVNEKMMAYVRHGRCRREKKNVATKKSQI